MSQRSSRPALFVISDVVRPPFFCSLFELVRNRHRLFCSYRDGVWRQHVVIALRTLHGPSNDQNWRRRCGDCSNLTHSAANKEQSRSVCVLHTAAVDWCRRRTTAAAGAGTTGAPGLIDELHRCESRQFRNNEFNTRNKRSILSPRICVFLVRLYARCSLYSAVSATAFYWRFWHEINLSRD